MKNKNLEVKRKIELEQQFNISRMKEMIKPTVPHKHGAYYEIILLKSGAGVHTIDDCNYEVNAPVIFFLNPGQVHCWEFTKIPIGYVCIFRDKYLDESYESKRHIYNMPPVLYIKNSPSGIESDFEQLFRAFQSDSNNAILKSYLNIVILKMVSLNQDGALPHITLNPLIKEFKNLVEQYYKEEKDLAFYADKLKVTKRRLSDICKKEVGRPATSILNERHILEGKRLLKHTIKTISEIAYELNFHDPSYFVKFFKTNTSYTPGQYRDLIK